MTVVNPKSISGITSITTPSGSDNLLTIHTNNGTERLRIDSTGATKIVTGIVTTLTATTGIVTTLTANTTTLLSDVSFTGASYNMTWDKSDNSLIVNDNARVKFGTGKDLHIYHNESNSVIREEGTGNLNLQTTGGNVEILVATTETAAKFISDGAVELYHNDTKKFETSSSGVTISGDNSSGSYIKGVTRFTPNDSTTVKVMWDETGFSDAGHFQVKDGVAFSVGNSSDLKIYHDGSHSYIADSGTGNLRVLTNSFTVNNTANSANLAQFTEGGSVELFHNGTKQCETSTNGLAFPSGKGIDFSATSDASGMASELLDDYEEGTFTPNFDAGGGVTFSYNHEHGFYTKIGNTVTFQLYLMGHAATITGGNEGNGVVIQGLPYTIQNHSRYYPAFTIGRTYNVQINDNKRLYAYGDSNSTNIRLIQEEDDTTGGILTAVQLDRNPCLIQVGGVYRI